MFKKIVFNREDEQINEAQYGIDFKLALQVVINLSSLKIRNIDGDFSYIGPLDDLSKILVVYCVREDEFIKIVSARHASKNESNSYFTFLMEGDLNE